MPTTRVPAPTSKVTLLRAMYPSSSTLLTQDSVEHGRLAGTSEMLASLQLEGRVHFKASTIRSTLVLTMPMYVSAPLPSTPMEPE